VFAAGADDQVGVGPAAGVEVGGDAVGGQALGDVVGGVAGLGFLFQQGADGVDDLLAAVVADGDGQVDRA
jgi:hypothetical protein